MNIKNLDTHIYEVIKRIRLAKSLSQEQLSHLANKDRTYISSIERKERNISLNTLIDILIALDVDFETFLEELKNEGL
jgi:transcriptional regulator with XRE-family HTH domain